MKLRITNLHVLLISFVLVTALSASMFKLDEIIRFLPSYLILILFMTLSLFFVAKMIRSMFKKDNNEIVIHNKFM